MRTIRVENQKKLKKIQKMKTSKKIAKFMKEVRMHQKTLAL